MKTHSTGEKIPKERKILCGCVVNTFKLKCNGIPGVDYVNEPVMCPKCQLYRWVCLDPVGEALILAKYGKEVGDDEEKI